MPSVKILNANNEWEYAASGGASGGDGGQAQENLDKHIADKENPHEVNKEQLGIYVGSEEPTDPNAMIWFDYNESETEADSSYYTAEEVDAKFATKEDLEGLVISGGSSVHVSADEPTDDNITIWIDTDDNEGSNYYTAE
jgi:hypothetical protein